ncbi:MAG: DMT family transporter [Alphaproteobacteria bacterium]|nr:DMT family transporter [Alphaproteobacteria bacterium]
MLIWSSAFVAVRAGLADVSPFYFLSVRFTLAALLLAAIASMGGVPWRGLAGRWVPFAIAGTLLNALYLGAGYLAMTRIGGASMALIGALHPLFTALLSMPLFGDRWRPAQWLGFAFGTVGVAVVAVAGLDDSFTAPGILWALGAVVCFVAGTLYYSRHGTTLGLVQANMVQLATSALVTWALTFAFEDIRANWTWAAVATLLHLTVVVSLGAMGLLLFMLRTGSAGKVAANFYLVPGVTAVMAWAILGEALTAVMLIGMAIASAGVWLVNRR